MFGFVKETPSDNDPSPTFTPLTNGLFNIPLYYVAVSANNYGHGMNAVLTGDNPLEFNDWCFVEPQTDDINVQSNTWNIPYNSELNIGKITKYLDYTQGIYPFLGYTVVKFNIDGSGNALVVYQSLACGIIQLNLAKYQMCFLHFCEHRPFNQLQKQQCLPT